MVRGGQEGWSGVRSCATLWDVDFFGSLCEPLPNLNHLPFIYCVTLASELNSLSLSLPVCQMGVGPARSVAPSLSAAAAT